MVPTLLLFDPESVIPLPLASGSPLCFQGLLLLYGAYLAGLTDHVSSPPVNQSLTIMVGVNLVVLAAGLLFVVTRYLHSWPNLVFGLTSGGIFVCTTTINCLIFIPQVCPRENLAGPVLQRIYRAIAHCNKLLTVFSIKTLGYHLLESQKEGGFLVSCLLLFFQPRSPEGRWLCSQSARGAAHSG